MPHTIRTPIAAFVFDAYGTLFDVHSVGALAERSGTRTWRRPVAPLAHQAARIHVAAIADGRRGRRSPRGLRPHHRARARLRRGRARPSVQFRAEAGAARRVRHAHRVPGRARRTRRAGAAPALDPVQRHAGRASIRSCATTAWRRWSTVCCRSISSTSTSRRRRCTRSPPDSSRLPPRPHRLRLRPTAGTRSAREPSASRRSGSTVANAPVDRHGPPPQYILPSLAELPDLAPP